MPESPEPTALYRLYDTEEDLLYIGISTNPPKRFKAHAHDKNWWHLVTYVDLTWFPTFTRARRAEDDAHVTERPPYNSMGRTTLTYEGQEIRALRYDDHAERAAVRDRVLEDLNAGRHKPGAHLWPFALSEATGYTRNSVFNALQELSNKGHLRALCKTFEVPVPEAAHEVR